MCVLSRPDVLRLCRQVCSVSWNPAETLYTRDGCVIWFPGSFQSLESSTAFPSASRGNVISCKGMWCGELTIGLTL